MVSFAIVSRTSAGRGRPKNLQPAPGGVAAIIEEAQGVVERMETAKLYTAIADGIELELKMTGVVCARSCLFDTALFVYEPDCVAVSGNCLSS